MGNSLLAVRGINHKYIVVGNCVPYDTKASGGRRTPRRGIWLLTQPRSGASVRQAHTFLFNRNAPQGGALRARFCYFGENGRGCEALVFCRFPGLGPACRGGAAVV